MARYRKFDPRFWKDEKVRSLTLTEKAIASYCITGQCNRIGIFSFSPGEGAEDLDIKPGTFGEGFKKVVKVLRFGWDEKARVMYLPRWWKYNTPENPNVLKAYLSDLHEVPNSPLIELFTKNLIYLPETFHITFAEGIAKAIGKQPPNQEIEIEIETEIEIELETSPLPPKGKESLNGFDQFWTLYPKKKAKAKAREAWKRVLPAKHEDIYAKVAEYVASEEWQREGGKWIPWPEKFLKEERWEDEITAVSPISTAAQQTLAAGQRLMDRLAKQEGR